MVICDSVLIGAPHGVAECRLLSGMEGDQQALERVRKVLAMERAKMDLKRDSGRMNANAGNAAARVAVPAASGGARKGG